jgi:hypothetical protein
MAYPEARLALRRPSQAMTGIATKGNSVIE